MTRPRTRILVGLIGLLVLSAAAWYLIYPPLSATYNLRHARSALADHDLSLARTRLQRVLEVRPDSAEANFLMARTCRSQEDFDAARHYLAEASRRNWPPDAVELENNLRIAQQFGPRGGNERMLQLIAHARHPEEKAIFEALAAGYRNTNHLNESAGWLTLWIEHYPDDWLPWVWRARLLDAFGHHDRAVEDWQRVLELRPTHAEAHLQLGRLGLVNGQDHQNALVHFEACLRLRPGDADALLGVARCQRLRDERDAALATLDRLLEQHPDHVAALVVRGTTAAEKGLVDEALTSLRRATALAPHDPEALYLMAMVSKPSDPAQSEEYLRRFLVADKIHREIDDTVQKILSCPKDAALRHRVGVLLLSVDQGEKAERWLLSALQEDPDHGPTHRALADYYEKASDPKAQAHRRRAEARP